MIHIAGGSQDVQDRARAAQHQTQEELGGRLSMPLTDVASFHALNFTALWQVDQHHCHAWLARSAPQIQPLPRAVTRNYSGADNINSVSNISGQLQAGGYVFFGRERRGPQS